MAAVSGRLTVVAVDQTEYDMMVEGIGDAPGVELVEVDAEALTLIVDVVVA